MSDNANGDASAERARGISQLDAALLRRVAELASRGGTSEEMQTLAKAIVGVIQTQAELAELLSQVMQHVAQSGRQQDV